MHLAAKHLSLSIAAALVIVMFAAFISVRPAWLAAGEFTRLSGVKMPGVSMGSAAWGDYDSDGDLDVLLTGARDYPGEQRIAHI